MNPNPPPGGLFDSLRRIADNALATVHNRAELFALELHEEKCRLVETMIWGAAVVALGVLGSALLLVVGLFVRRRAHALVALALGAPGPAMAQGAMKDMMTKDHAMRASKLIGADVYNDQEVFYCLGLTVAN